MGPPWHWQRIRREHLGNSCTKARRASPIVGLEGDGESSDIVPSAILSTDQAGFETIAIKSGIPSHGAKLVFVKTGARRSGKIVKNPRKNRNPSRNVVTRPGILSDQTRSQTQIMTPGPIRPSNSCGPVTREVGYNLGIVDDGDWIARSPSLIYFRNRLHLLTGYYPRGFKWTDPFKFDGFVHGSHRMFDGQTWSSIGDAPTNNKMALAVFNRNLWAVWKDSDKKLRFSRYYDQWSRPIEIRGQYSKSPPAIAVRGGKLHMVHQGKSSDNLWHSTFTPGRGWSENVKMGQKSQWTPGFARTVDGRLHLVYQMSSGTGIIKNMLHSFLGNDGKRWLKPYKFSDAKTKDVPTILGGLSSDIRGRALMVHQGKSSNSLWSMLYGKTDSKRTSTKRWHDEQQLLRRKSDSPVALGWYKGCVHMVHREGKKLMHTTFSLKQAHPEVLN